MAEIHELLDGEMTADPSWDDPEATVLWRPNARYAWIETLYRVSDGSLTEVAYLVSRWVPSARALGRVIPITP